MNTQCQCCASPLGERIRIEATERIVCLRCLGFIAGWLIELENPLSASAEALTTHPAGADAPASQPTNEKEKCP